jgi:hypothetical protein
MEDTRHTRRQTRAGRFYELPDGRLVPSITTILSVIGKRALVGWAGKVERELVMQASADLFEEMRGSDGKPHVLGKLSRLGWITRLEGRVGKAKAAQRELAKAAEIGSQTHAMIEWSLRQELGQRPGPMPELGVKAGRAFRAWLDWRAGVKLKPLHIEQVVYSGMHGCAGTFDLDAEVGGVETLLDWKTGKRVYWEAKLQNAAYRNMLREMGHGDPKRGLIVRLPKQDSDPGFEVVSAGEEAENFETFLLVKRLWEKQAQAEESERGK